MTQLVLPLMKPDTESVTCILKWPKYNHYDSHNVLMA